MSYGKIIEMDPNKPRGRPPIRSDKEILRAALSAFAALGFEAMSVRALNAKLGVSHETISQRFGSKRSLYFAAVDFGIAEFLATLSEARGNQPNDIDDLDEIGELRATIHSFMTAASRHPELGRLVNQEGLEANERLDYLVANAFDPIARPLVELVARLVEQGIIRPISARELFFFGQAGAAPFNLPQLSSAFDVVDGPIDLADHIDRMTELIMRSIR